VTCGKNHKGISQNPLVEKLPSRKEVFEMRDKTTGFQNFIRFTTAVFCVFGLVLGVFPSAAPADFEFHVTNWNSLCNFIKNYANSTEMSIIYLDDNIDAEISATVGPAASPKWVTIEGQGHTIDAGGRALSSLRFANTAAAASASNNIALRNLTMKNFQTQDANGGGAIGVRGGKLTIKNCSFIGNKTEGQALCRRYRHVSGEADFRDSRERHERDRTYRQRRGQ
jgi:hypothetical protein